MKFNRVVLYAAVLSVSVLGVAQTGAQKPAGGMDHSAKQASPPPNEAQKSFAAMKSLAGEWKGTAKMEPAMNGATMATVDVTMRVTSRGNSFIHEMQEANTPLDASKYDHPITMFYVEGGKLYLRHYCDAGNRPRMSGTVSPDGKRIEFDLVDVDGGNQRGHMHHAVFTIIDGDHHVEEWTYMMPGDKPVHATMEMQRVKDGGSSSGK